MIEIVANINLGIIAVCLVLSVFQKNMDNLISAAVFTGLLFAFENGSSLVASDYYYLADAATAFFSSYLIKFFGCKSELSVIIQDVCFASIALNFIGWGIYMAYMSPIVYNLAFLALYLYLGIMLIIKGDGNVIGGIFRGSEITRNGRNDTGILVINRKNLAQQKRYKEAE